MKRNTEATMNSSITYGIYSAFRDKWLMPEGGWTTSRQDAVAFRTMAEATELLLDHGLRDSTNASPNAAYVACLHYL